MFRALTIAAITTAVVFSDQFVFSDPGKDAAIYLNKGLLNPVYNSETVDPHASYTVENVAEMSDVVADNFASTRHVDANSLSPPVFSLSSGF